MPRDADAGLATAFFCLVVAIVSFILVIVLGTLSEHCKDDQAKYMGDCLEDVCGGQCIPLIADCSEIAERFKPICNTSCRAAIDACAAFQPYGCDGLRVATFVCLALGGTSAVVVHCMAYWGRNR